MSLIITLDKIKELSKHLKRKISLTPGLNLDLIDYYSAQISRITTGSGITGIKMLLCLMIY